MQERSQKLITRIVPEKILKENEKALETYDIYRETRDIIERAEEAMGKRVKYTTTTDSTIHHVYKPHGIISTQNF